MALGPIFDAIEGATAGIALANKYTIFEMAIEFKFVGVKVEKKTGTIEDDVITWHTTEILEDMDYEFLAGNAKPDNMEQSINVFDNDDSRKDLRNLFKRVRENIKKLGTLGDILSNHVAGVEGCMNGGVEDE